MPPQNTADAYNVLKALTEQYLPKDNLEHVVSEADQLKEIDLLQKTQRLEKFFFVVNLHDLSMSSIHGVQKLLGYSTDFGFKEYLGLIHPAHAIPRNLLGQEVLRYVLSAKSQIGFGTHLFVSFVALRHANGSYILFKQFATVFQHDKDYRTLQFLNELSYWGAYTGQAYEFRIIDNQNQPVAWEEKIKEVVQKKFAQTVSPFSGREMQILHAYIQQPQITQKEIADNLTTTKKIITPKEVSTYCRRIIKKADEKLNMQYSSAQQVAQALQKCWLI